jgi:hypothetical protein
MMHLWIGFECTRMVIGSWQVLKPRILRTSLKFSWNKKWRLDIRLINREYELDSGLVLCPVYLIFGYFSQLVTRNFLGLWLIVLNGVHKISEWTPACVYRLLFRLHIFILVIQKLSPKLFVWSSTCSWVDFTLCVYSSLWVRYSSSFWCSSLEWCNLSFSCMNSLPQYWHLTIGWWCTRRECFIN